MNIEAVIVCKDYGDFLAETLPLNLPHLDHLVVVTHWTDKETIALCSKYSVECVQAHVFDEDGDRFNKGRAVNVGLAHLRRPEKILHIDADIVLPNRFRELMGRAKLNKENIYGCDRMNVFGSDEWDKIKSEMGPHYQDHWFVDPKGQSMGSRIIHREHGYVPLGYFQLWDIAQHKKYPIYEGTAEHSDVLFAIQWSRAQRLLLPEMFVYHLESTNDSQPMGANWKGRKTPRFRCHKHHHHKHHPHPYCPDKK